MYRELPIRRRGKRRCVAVFLISFIYTQSLLKELHGIGGEFCGWWKAGKWPPRESQVIDREPDNRSFLVFCFPAL
jgi:hypothetical protein